MEQASAPQNEPERRQEPKKSPIDIILVCDRFELVPSNETPLGKALANAISQFTGNESKFVNFKSPYTLNLVTSTGKVFNEEPLQVKGFKIGRTAEGGVSITKMIDAEGKRVPVPLLLVIEDGGTWKMSPSALGWGEEIRKLESNAESNDGRVIKFGNKGIHLVLFSELASDVIRMPSHIKSVRLGKNGTIKEAKLLNGETLRPSATDISSGELPSFDPDAILNSDIDDYELEKVPPSKNRAEEYKADIELPPTTHKASAKELFTEVPLRTLTLERIRSKNSHPDVEALFKRALTKALASPDSSDISLLEEFRAEFKSSKTREELLPLIDTIAHWQHENSKSNFIRVFRAPEYYQNLRKVSWFLSSLMSELEKRESENYQNKHRKEA